ncbi:hypothetical protein [Enhygromyxa salina]|uniref:hypothetical protein n=1 Tax=Enhygromyxa salina TaxID=215803 RepID=UPI0004E71917|nr:hypothetical protein [Enhygromyxa salina]
MSMLVTACDDEAFELGDEQVLEELEEAMLEFEVEEVEPVGENTSELPVLAAEDDTNVWGNIYAHNVIHTFVFDPIGPDYCRFHLFYGNYPTGYAWIKFDPEPGGGASRCGAVTSRVVTYDGQYHIGDALRWTPGVWAQAAPGVGNVIQASFCVESHYWGRQVMVFNALTRTREHFYTNPGLTCY